MFLGSGIYCVPHLLIHGASLIIRGGLSSREALSAVGRRQAYLVGWSILQGRIPNVLSIVRGNV